MVVAEIADRPGKAALLRATADEYARAVRELGVDSGAALASLQ
jgi:GntR family transcriptional regulator